MNYIRNKILPSNLRNYSSMYIDGTTSLQIIRSYAEKQKKFGEEKVERFRQFQNEFGTPALEPIAAKYDSEII